MRIITGKARGMKLRTLEGLATRPTSEAAKEGMFSAIQFELHDRRVLDLFGGSGQLALEALSRGAEFAVINDASREAANIIKENAQKTKLMPQCRILSADWKDYIRMAKGREQFDLILLDPPYAEVFLENALKRITEIDILETNGIIVTERPLEKSLPWEFDGYIRSKDYKYGKTLLTIYRKQ